MCRNINMVRDRKPWNAEAWVSDSNNFGPPSSANCNAYLCSLVSRRMRRNAACRVSASTGILMRLTTDLNRKALT